MHINLYIPWWLFPTAFFMIGIIFMISGKRQKKKGGGKPIADYPIYIPNFDGAGECGIGTIMIVIGLALTIGHFL